MSQLRNVFEHGLLLMNNGVAFRYIYVLKTDF